MLKCGGRAVYPQECLARVLSGVSVVRALEGTDLFKKIDMPQLRVLLGHQQGQVYSLDSRPLSIGREPTSDVILSPDSPASRRHAEIVCEDGEWRIRDLESRNGTELNGARVKLGTLNHDDEILVGDSVFIFQYCDRCTAETVAAASRAIPSEPMGLQNEPATQSLVKSMAEKTMRMERETARLLGTQAATVRDVLTAILAGGHCLLTGFAEPAKAAVLNAAGSLLNLRSQRVRVTPGTRFEDIAEGAVASGAWASEVFMVEGLQHASPKTQAEICDAMGGGRAAQHTRPTAEALCVLATVESSSALTNEARDQFMFSLAANPAEPMPAAVFESLITEEQLASLRALVRDFALDEALIAQAVNIACATRPSHKESPSSVKRCVATGAGPNTARALLLSAKARAVLGGRTVATEEDLRAVALPVLRHRISLNEAAAAERADEERVIRKVLAAVLGS